eukprot:comp23487_c0_seq1/m.39295 comp23487_c0_seq1/g.39295  ORF comp23487_c0_seq1/g.39295 comp23487_c0_seq1/m.39295 type:complete len:303 (+) comp23487_c0_seq1:690-1598(+)
MGIPPIPPPIPPVIPPIPIPPAIGAGAPIPMGLIWFIGPVLPPWKGLGRVEAGWAAMPPPSAKGFCGVDPVMGLLVGARASRLTRSLCFSRMLGFLACGFCSVVACSGAPGRFESRPFISHGSTEPPEVAEAREGLRLDRLANSSILLEFLAMLPSSAMAPPGAPAGAFFPGEANGAAAAGGAPHGSEEAGVGALTGAPHGSFEGAGALGTEEGAPQGSEAGVDVGAVLAGEPHGSAEAGLGAGAAPNGLLPPASPERRRWKSVLGAAAAGEEPQGEACAGVGAPKAEPNGSDWATEGLWAG